MRALWRPSITLPSSLAVHKNSIMAVLFLRHFVFFGLAECCVLVIALYPFKTLLLFQFPWSFIVGVVVFNTTCQGHNED